AGFPHTSLGIGTLAWTQGHTYLAVAALGITDTVVLTDETGQVYDGYMVKGPDPYCNLGPSGLYNRRYLVQVFRHETGNVHYGAMVGSFDDPSKAQPVELEVVGGVPGEQSLGESRWVWTNSGPGVFSWPAHG